MPPSHRKSGTTIHGVLFRRAAANQQKRHTATVVALICATAALLALYHSMGGNSGLPARNLALLSAAVPNQQEAMSSKLKQQNQQQRHLLQGKEEEESSTSSQTLNHNNEKQEQPQQKYYSVLVRPKREVIQQACWLMQNIEYLERLEEEEQDQQGKTETARDETTAMQRRLNSNNNNTTTTSSSSKPLFAIFVVNHTMDRHHRPRFYLEHMINYTAPGVKLWQQQELADKYPKKPGNGQALVMNGTILIPGEGPYANVKADSAVLNGQNAQENDDTNDAANDGPEEDGDADDSHADDNDTNDEDNKDETDHGEQENDASDAKPSSLDNGANDGATATARRRLSEASNQGIDHDDNDSFWHNERFQRQQHYGVTPATQWVHEELIRLCGSNSDNALHNNHYKSNEPPKHKQHQPNANHPIDMSRVRIRELSLFPWQFGPKQRKIPVPMRHWPVGFQRVRLFDPDLYRGLEQEVLQPIQPQEQPQEPPMPMASDEIPTAAATAVPPPPVPYDQANPKAPDISVLYMTMDLLLRKDISHLLNVRQHAIVGWQSSKSRQFASEHYANTGVMLIRPNTKDYQLLVDKAQELAQPDFGDIIPAPLRIDNTSQTYKMMHDRKLRRKMRKENITQFPKVHKEGMGTGGLTEQELKIKTWQHKELFKYREMVLKSGEQTFMNWVFHGFAVPKFLHLGHAYNLMLPFCDFGAHEILRDDFALVQSAPRHKFWQRGRGYRRVPCIGIYNDEWHDLHPGVNHHLYYSKKRRRKLAKSKKKKADTKKEGRTRRERRERREKAAAAASGGT